MIFEWLDRIFGVKREENEPEAEAARFASNLQLKSNALDYYTKHREEYRTRLIRLLAMAGPKGIVDAEAKKQMLCSNYRHDLAVSYALSELLEEGKVHWRRELCPEGMTNRWTWKSC